MHRVVVVGAGVVGLTCAVRLLETGHRVDVVARDLPLETTSAVAAGLVHRQLDSQLLEPSDPVEAWRRRSLEVFDELEREPGDPGVRALEGTELPDGVVRVAPVVDVPVHLRWLAARVEGLGGTVTRLNLSGLPEHGDVVVNCSGLGARLLGGDHSVVPSAGQVVGVEQFGLERWWLDARGPTYLVPREHDVVVGGTDDTGEWSRTPSPEAATDILRRAAVMVPAVAHARVLRHKVGLRPSRPAVRLERDGRVVHCYGHGDSGVALAWGCADDVVRLVEQV